MDANGTRFHLLLGMSDWGACAVQSQPGTLADVWQGLPTGELLTRQGWDATRSELTLPAQVFEFPVAPRHVQPRLDQRRGADADTYGNWYWIDDAERSILVRSAGSGTVTTFWSVGLATGTDPADQPPPGVFSACDPPPAAPAVLRGLAVTPDHYLVVGVAQPPGLLTFDLHAGGAPRHAAWLPGFQPFDMASGASGTWILERDSVRPGGRLWLLDAGLNPVRLGAQTVTVPLPPTFQAVDGSPPLGGQVCQAAPALANDLAFDLPALSLPVAVEALPDGSALILDNADPHFSQIWRFSVGQALASPFSLKDVANLVRADERPAFTLLGHDFACLPNPSGTDPSTLGTLLVVSQNGEQAFAFAIVQAGTGALRLDALPEYWPMRLYGGRGLLSSGGHCSYDSRGAWVPLVQQPRLRYEAVRTVLTPVEADASNTTVRHAFDGRDPDCVWHRLLMDACIPHETEVHIASRAANTEAELVNTDWQSEPDPYRRADGSELPFVADTGQGERGTWELLFQRARGRFLQLRITLVGNTRSSPRLRALRAYYPRFSYLQHYLPAAYRDEPQSASFLDRFLANLEGLYTTLEDRLDAIQALFDSRAAPAADLAWLATWLGIVIDGNWDEARQRLLIAMAPELFRLRGTRQGLIRAVRLATDACPSAAIFDNDQDDEALAGAAQPGRLPASVRIVEQFRTRSAPGVIFGDPSQIQGPGVSTPTWSWVPEHGPAPLHVRFRTYLLQVYSTLAGLNAAWGSDFADISEVMLPPTRPNTAAMATDWSHFLAARLGFTYAEVDARDEPVYRDFLTRRYGTPGRLSDAYGLRGSAAYTVFADVRLPTQLPTQPDQLRDWIQFVSILVPTFRNAHRFTVLVPTVTGNADNDRGLLLDRVRRVVELEKPAHTAFEVKEYWALFRVGEARLGFDTLVDRGSRLVPTVLDASYLAQGYLVPPHPYNLVERMVLGRDRLEDRRPV